MDLPTIKPGWRTGDVVGICRGVRETQDFSALPILADALQDAGCDDEALLKKLRGPTPRYPVAAGLVACVLSDETWYAVHWLAAFAGTHDCPEYETLVAAAAGHHEENGVEGGDTEPYPQYYCSELRYGEYLFFGGRDAHGEIPPEFWDKVVLATGKIIPDDKRATQFDCSC